MTKLLENITAELNNSKILKDLSNCERFFSVLYDDLRALADGQIQQEMVGHTLTGTALVHEVFIKLARLAGRDWDDHQHFLNSAATVMRHTLIDHARKRNAQKRNGNLHRRGDITITDGAVFSLAPDVSLKVNDALEALETHSAAHAKLVELRFFCNLTHRQIADIMKMSEASVRRRWAYSRAWLNEYLESSNG